jgi:aryl-alcohol dehydrogenase-like predicted oxidoreductase
MAGCPSRRDFLKSGSSFVIAAGLGSVPTGSASARGEAQGVSGLKSSHQEPIREFRRGGMLYRRLGRTDLFVSVLSFGSHTDPAFKRPTKQGNVLSDEGQTRRDRQLARAFDRGVNMVDTYENEGQWEPVARLVRPRRDKLLVSLCRQFPVFVGENIDQAAKLYGHVDLYRIYVGDGPGVDGQILEDWDVMRKAKAAGKVRAIGISTHSERMMTSALEELEGLDYVMFPYNFIHARADYSEFLPAAVKKGVGLIAIKPLAAGSIVKLDPRARPGSKPENERIELYQARSHPLLPAVVDELTKSLTRLPDESLCQAALRFVYSRPFMTCAMPGIFQDHELEDNYAALSRHLELSREETAALDAAGRLAELRRGSWLPRRYHWLDDRWRKSDQA